MIQPRIRRLATRAALIIQALLISACAAQAQPVVFAMEESATEAPQAGETTASPTTSPYPSRTAEPTATLRPTATPPPPTATPAPTATPLPTPIPVEAAELEGLGLVEALLSGGYVLYFRHAATDMTQSDTSSANLADCSTQRNLTEQGRADALALGAAILELGIPIGEVRSSAYCRTRETALLAFGEAVTSTDLTGFPSDLTEERTATLRILLSTPPASGSNSVLVAHNLNIGAAAGLDLAEGEAAVFLPLGGGNFQLVGRVLPGDWEMLRQTAGERLTSDPAADPDLLLPDLAMLPPSNLVILSNSDTGERQLKFTTSIQNNGPGVIEIWGHSDETSEKTIVVQHIRQVGGSEKKVVVGEFVFHPDHDHFHFGNFACYEVWTMSRDGSLEALAGVTDKVSYCLRDDERADLPVGSAEQTYLGCNRGVQGISPGWVDVYRYDLFGQTVDVTDLADGYYALINYVDPDRQLWELDQENNAAMVFFRLEGGRVSTVEYEQIVCDAASCAD